MAFLDEQLERVYLTEDFEKSFPLIKARIGAITDSIKSGNLFKARDLLNKLPNVSLEELAISSQRKNRKFYDEAKRYVKGDETELKQMYILSYVSLKSIQASIKDKSAFEKIEEALSDLNDITKKYWNQFMVKGFTLHLLMALIGWFFGRLPGVIVLLLTFGAIAGIILFWLGVLFMVLRIILNTYFSLKGIK